MTKDSSHNNPYKDSSFNERWDESNKPVVITSSDHVKAVVKQHEIDSILKDRNKLTVIFSEFEQSHPEVFAAMKHKDKVNFKLECELSDLKTELNHIKAKQ